MTAQVCRSCGASQLMTVLPFGEMPLANALRTASQLKETEPVYSLTLAFCPTCTLVQITETVPPEVLFREYVYFSSFSDTLLEHASQLAQNMIHSRGLGAGSMVIEAASNDGYLLQFYKRAGVPVLGIDPAQNIAKAARERGIPTRDEFFTESLAQKLVAEGIQADVFHGHNVLAHVADLNGFVRGIRRVLKDTGVAVIEVPYVKPMLDHCEFDTIYHEHLCYFSLTALDYCFARQGLLIQDAERLPIHGGSLRLFAVPARPGNERGARAAKLLEEERQWGVASPAPYQAFRGKVEELRTKLKEMLADFKKQGKRLAAYGASAKGSTLLNYFKIGTETLDFVADRSTVKQGHFMSGNQLPIYSAKQLMEAMPDYTLLLTWNFADEILKQQQAYRDRGGRFIIPLPQPHVV
jgi:SAM-dependent methyltransferase